MASKHRYLGVYAKKCKEIEWNGEIPVLTVADGEQRVPDDVGNQPPAILGADLMSRSMAVPRGGQ